MPRSSRPSRLRLTRPRARAQLATAMARTSSRSRVSVAAVDEAERGPARRAGQVRAEHEPDRVDHVLHEDGRTRRWPAPGRRPTAGWREGRPGRRAGPLQAGEHQGDAPGDAVVDGQVAQRRGAEGGEGRVAQRDLARGPDQQRQRAEDDDHRQAAGPHRELGADDVGDGQQARAAPTPVSAATRRALTGGAAAGDGHGRRGRWRGASAPGRRSSTAMSTRNGHARREAVERRAWRSGTSWPATRARRRRGRRRRSAGRLVNRPMAQAPKAWTTSRVSRMASRLSVGASRMPDSDGERRSR